jgi:hypothetical protein
MQADLVRSRGALVERRPLQVEQDRISRRRSRVSTGRRYCNSHHVIKKLRWAVRPKSANPRIIAKLESGHFALLRRHIPRRLATPVREISMAKAIAESAWPASNRRWISASPASLNGPPGYRRYRVALGSRIVVVCSVRESGPFPFVCRHIPRRLATPVREIPIPKAITESVCPASNRRWISASPASLNGPPGYRRYRVISASDASAVCSASKSVAIARAVSMAASRARNFCCSTISIRNLSPSFRAIPL